MFTAMNNSPKQPTDFTTLLYCIYKDGVTMLSHWTLLKNPPTWEKILHSTKHTVDVHKNIMMILDEYVLFDEFIHIANVNKTRMYESNTNLLQLLKRDLKYSCLCEVNEFRLKKHTIQFGILFLPFLVLAQL
jgi:hypothetical protein